MVLATSLHRAQRFRALDRGIQTSLTRRLHRFFVAQARRVVGRYRDEFFKAIDPNDEPAGQPPNAEELLPDSERREFWLAVLPFLLQATLNASDHAGLLVGLSVTVETDPRVQRLLSEAQLHLAGVHDTTLSAIRATLAEGFRRGYSARQIAYGVPAENFRGLADSVAEVYSGRARTIATTELATARNKASLERYQEAGVNTVYIVDGPGCGWTRHDDPDLANGSIRTLSEAHASPTSHANCQRVLLPGR